MAPYPTKAEIEQLCSALASSDTSPFFSRVAPDVTWDVMGTHPAAGHFTSLQAWKDAALGTIQKVLKEPIALKPTNVVGGGDQEWAAVELEANAVCKNGMSRFSPAYTQPLANAPLVRSTAIDTRARHALQSALLLDAKV